MREAIAARLLALDRAQRRRAWLAVPVAVWKRFVEDGGGNLAAVLTYYGFLSLFPLLLVFTTVLGYVLQGHPGVYRTVVDSAMGDFPVVGDQLRSRSLSGNGIALAVGLAAALWSGLRIVVAAEQAFEQIWAVPRSRRRGFVRARVRALLTLAAVGVLNVVATGISGLVSGGLGGLGLAVGGIAVSVVIDLLLFATAFRLLTDESVTLRALVPGIVAGAVAWQILQSGGGLYVAHVVRSASSTYGTFAIVIGLLVWLNLGARVVLLAMELNVVASRHLWPRGLFPHDADELRRGSERSSSVWAADHNPDNTCVLAGRSKERSMKDWQKYLAEVFGTFTLVFMGTTAVVASFRLGGGAAELIAPFAFGLALLAGLYAFGEVSGGHFNPAVSLGLFLDRRLSATDLVGYWASQVAGAILASLVVLLAFSKNDVAATATHPSSNGTALVLEITLTAIFVAVILQATKSGTYGSSALVAIPLTLVAIHFAAVPFSGSSVNPARSLGPALVGSEWTSFWIYVVGPLAGAIIAWIVHTVVVKGDTDFKDDMAYVRGQMGRGESTSAEGGAG